MHSEIGKENKTSNFEQINLDAIDSGLGLRELNKKDRKKTVIRMQFDGEAELIQKQIGTLEEVRIKLDLSARKMCQLLMVDPSAWNRWTTGITSPPPHIFRALQWYMILNEKLPGVDPRFFLPKRSFLRSQGELSQNLNLETSPVTQELREKVSEQIKATQYYQSQSKNYEIEVKLLKNQLGTIQKILTIVLLTLAVVFIVGFLKIISH